MPEDDFAAETDVDAGAEPAPAFARVEERIVPAEERTVPAELAGKHQIHLFLMLKV